MTLRRIILIIASVFNLFCSICSMYAFFSMFPKLAIAYFLISLPLTIYALVAKPNKVLDSNWGFDAKFAEEKLGTNPF